MVRDFKNARRFRVGVPFKRSDYLKLERIAARRGIALSRLILSFADQEMKKALTDPDMQAIPIEAESSGQAAKSK